MLKTLSNPIRVALIAMEYLPYLRRIVAAIDRIRAMTSAERRNLMAGMLQRLEADVNEIARESGDDDGDDHRPA